VLAQQVGVLVVHLDGTALVVDADVALLTKQKKAPYSPEPEGACLTPLALILQFWMGVVPGPWVYACLQGPRSARNLLAGSCQDEREGQSSSQERRLLFLQAWEFISS